MTVKLKKSCKNKQMVELFLLRKLILIQFFCQVRNTYSLYSPTTKSNLLVIFDLCYLYYLVILLGYRSWRRTESQSSTEGSSGGYQWESLGPSGQIMMHMLAELQIMSTCLQLRYLQTLSTISAEHNSTIIFPMPVNIMDQFVGKTKLNWGGGPELTIYLLFDVRRILSRGRGRI